MVSATVNNNPLPLLPLLPEDVLVEILSRLPVESILRFKCVCKSWYTLFNDPTFAAKHLQLIKANHDNQLVFLKHSLYDDSHFEQYFDGFYYWWGMEEGTNVLISFDMAEDVFRKMPMPDFVIDSDEFSNPDDIGSVFPRIGVYNNDCIALYVSDDLPSVKSHMDLWVLKEFGVKESWTKQLTITASAAQMNHPLLFWKNNEEVLYDEEQGNLFSYNLITHESKSLPLHHGRI